MVRRLAVLLAALACAVAVLPGAAATAVPVPVLGPGAGGFHTYALKAGHGDDPIADIASGFDVLVVPGTPHAARLAEAIAYGVSQLRRYGIDVRYRGLRKPAGLDTVGVIAVREASATSDAVCHLHTADSGTITEASASPDVQDVGLMMRINSARLTFCPPVWGDDQHYLRAVALHELGHAVGLGHFRGTYQGATQVMNPIVPDVDTYQAGDVNGLRYLAAETAGLRAVSALSGVVESWRVTPLGLRVSGWAVVGHTSEFATISVLRDGAPLYRISTGTARPDIVAEHLTGWPDPGFTGGPIAMATGRHRYCVVAGDPSIASARRVLGCRVLSFPLPAATVPARGPQGGAAAVSAVLGTSRLEPSLFGGLGVLAALVLLIGWVVVRRRRA